MNHSNGYGGYGNGYGRDAKKPSNSERVTYANRNVDRARVSVCTEGKNVDGKTRVGKTRKQRRPNGNGEAKEKSIIDNGWASAGGHRTTQGGLK